MCVNNHCEFLFTGGLCPLRSRLYVTQSHVYAHVFTIVNTPPHKHRPVPSILPYSLARKTSLVSFMAS